MRLLLLPFSWIFLGITSFRNFLFDKKILKSKSYQLPVISIGNITVGGTGKTPLTEYIIGLLSDKMLCVMLSMGYGRKTKGALIANNSSTYKDIGDEPMQIKSKFKNLIVAVAEKRVHGMEALLKLPQPPEVVVLDDSFQHRYINPGLSILMMDYYRPVWEDFLLPAGNLRESRKSMKRADIVVVNKCPKNLSKYEMDIIKDKLKHNNHQRLFFTAIDYKEPVSLTNDVKEPFFDIIKDRKSPIITVAGIGNPLPFFEMVKNFGKPVNTFSFRDHYHFSISDINKIINSVKSLDNDEPPLIITTEKDAVRIRAISGLTSFQASCIWYIPIELGFLFKNRFDKLIYDFVKLKN